jgi:hypothetical protein
MAVFGYLRYGSIVMLAELDVHFFCHDLKSFISRPQKAKVNAARSKDVDIYQADASAHQTVALNEQEELIVLHLGCARQRMKQSDDLFPVA